MGQARGWGGGGGGSSSLSLVRAPLLERGPHHVKVPTLTYPAPPPNQASTLTTSHHPTSLISCARSSRLSSDGRGNLGASPKPPRALRRKGGQRR